MNAAPITLADLEATPVPSVPIAQGVRRSYQVGSSRHGSISGRELSFVSDVAREFAVGYHAAPFVAGLVASMGQREVQIQADGGRAEPIYWKSCLIPLMAWVRARFVSAAGCQPLLLRSC